MTHPPLRHRSPPPLATLETGAVPTITTGTVSGVCHGTLGELFQGPVPHRGAESIGIVSFPVDRYTWAHFDPGQSTVGSLPALAKAARAARLFVDRYGLDLPSGRWSSHTELDIGVGMASSTADIVATLRCLFQVFELPYDVRAITDILAEIERADSVFLDEFALYLSGRHQVVESFGTAVGFHTCYVVEPGTVDTAAVTPLLLRHYRASRRSYRECLEELLEAFRAGDSAGVARAATASADLSQQVLPKATYDAVLANRERLGADGIFVAHTGAVIGYLFVRRLPRQRMDEVSAFFRRLGHQCSFAWGGYGHP